MNQYTDDCNSLPNVLSVFEEQIEIKSTEDHKLEYQHTDPRSGTTKRKLTLSNEVVVWLYS